MSDPLSVIGKTATDAILLPIQQRINSELDKVAFQARAKIAYSRGIQPNQVSDLEVAEYMISMPLSATNSEIALAANSVRNGIIAGFALLGSAVLINGLLNKHRQENE
jgi:hypothetical protein